MTKLERKHLKVFGGDADIKNIGQFGSAAANIKLNTDDIEEIQELDAWTEGWTAATLSQNRYPALQERNGLDKVMTYQTAYILQEGIPEWNVQTEYSNTSIVKVLEGSDIKLYRSLKDSNIGNMLTDSTSWEELKLGGGSGFNLFDTKLSDHILEGEEAKGWALQGTYVYKEGISGVRDGYPDFYNKVLEYYDNATETKTEYLSSNVNTVGTLVNKNGVLSVFRITNYATLPNYFAPASNPWEFVVKITTGDLSAMSMVVGCTTKFKSGFTLAVTTDKTLKVYLSSNGSSWNIGQPNGSFEYSANTEYWFKVEFTGSAYNVYYSIDGTAWNLDITVASTTAIYQDSYNWVLGNGAVGGDDWYANTQSLDLNESYININGERWWSGVNTYEYQQSSNGLKFYNISNKSTIDEIFNKTGLAWFYGIDTENERVFLPRNIYLTSHIENKQHPVVGNGMTLGMIGAHRSGADVATGLGSCDEGDSNTENVRLMKYTGVPVGSRTGSYNTSNNNSVESIGITKEEDISGVVANIKNVQNGSYVYICVGNTKVETAVTEVVDVTTTKNDTIPLFTGQYFDFTPNNVSWLKAGQQTNSGTIYTTAYNELVNCLNGVNKYNLKVINVADMISGVDYSEYWKVNQDEMYFVTPTKLSYGALTGGVLGNGMTLTVTDGTKDYGIVTSVVSGSAGSFCAYDGVAGTPINTTKSGDYLTTGKTLGVTTDTTKSGIIAEQSTAELYFKVANAVQNLELLNVGEVMEAVSDKISRQDCVAYITESFVDGTSGYNVYSNGYCEQWGTYGTETQTGVDSNQTITLLKPYKDTNYSVMCSHQYTNTTYNSNAHIYSKTNVDFIFTTQKGINYWQTKGYIS